jgi:hypothetical protein
LATLLASAAESSKSDAQTNQFKVYPWLEDSEFARVDKRLLREISIPPVTVTNHETMQFVLTQEFVRAFRLTPPEIDQVSRAITNAQHEYRIAEGRHLESTGPPAQGPAQFGLVAGERFTFRLIRFPQEAAAIRKRLEDVVLSTLGEERTKCFWENGWLGLESDMNTFSKPMMFTPTNFIFSLPASNPGRVDLLRTASGGSDGRTYTESLDQYAPESIKPVIARWRKEAAEKAPQRETSTNSQATEASAKPENVAATSNSANLNRSSNQTIAESAAGSQTTSRWEDGVSFVDLPKKLIPSLKVPGLTLDEEISPETAALFGLTPDEQTAARALYDDMRTQFENVERAHFERTELGSFVMKAFPEKSNALKNEWVKKLKELVGNARGEMLDQAIRTEFTLDHIIRRRALGRDVRRLMFNEPGQTWLHRGTTETKLIVTSGIDQKGRPCITHLEERTEGGGNRVGGVPDGEVPKRWRHLLPTDVLGVPLTL